MYMSQLGRWSEMERILLYLLFGHIFYDCNGMCMIQLPEHELSCNADVTSVLELSHHPHSTWSKYPPA
jgi:hypothetical protein